MPSLNLDLPQEVLDEVARLAQQLNVHRVDVFVRAVENLAQSLALEKEIAQARTELGEARETITTLERAVAAEEARIDELSGDLAESRRETNAARKSKTSLLSEISALRAAAAKMAGGQQDLIDQRDAARARSDEMEERDRKKTLATMRNAEVEKTRRHAQELAVRAQKLQEEIEYQRMDTALKSKKLETVSQRLQTASRMRKKLQADSARQKKDLFRSERQIGQLMRDRAKLRSDLKELGRLLNRGAAAGPAARKPKGRTGRKK